MPSPQKADDPWREHLSRFASGFEHFFNSFQQLHVQSNTSNALQAKTRSILVTLAIRCLVLQTALNLLSSQLNQNICTAYNQLFFPTVLLYRYLKPDRWDNLFMNTVRALGCDTRSDIVARPGPRHFVQLRQYLKRTMKAYFVVGGVNWLMNRGGIFSWPSMFLALLAVQQYLRHNGVRQAALKLLFVTAFIGPRWTVWLVQVWIQQQLFLYELLQPYLARVQFKEWEELAWWQEHEKELQGFALGAWMLCSVPVLGVMAIPLMFPAVAFLLSRSCGLMENSGHGLAGDIIEKRYPGVKAVALGKSKAVVGDWDSISVETFVRNTTVQSYSTPSQHAKVVNKDGHSTAASHAIDKGDGSNAVSESRIRQDSELAQERKQALYRVRRHHEQGQRLQQDQHLLAQQMTGHQTASDTFLSVGSAPNAPPTAKSMAPSTEPESSSGPGPAETLQPKDLTQYNFSDRKPVETAPSAPPALAFIPPLISSDMQGWSEHMSHNLSGQEENDIYRVQPPMDSTVWSASEGGSSATSPQRRKEEHRRQKEEHRRQKEEHRRQKADHQRQREEHRRQKEEHHRQKQEHHRQREEHRRQMEEHQRANDGNQQLRKVQERSKRLVKKKVQKLLGTVAPGVVIISKGDRRKKHGQGEDDSSTDTGSEESTSEESETSSESDSSAIDEEEYEKRQCKRAEDMAAELDAEAEYYDRGGRQGERIPMRPRTESDQSRRTPAQHIGGQRQHSTTGSESPSTVGTSSGGVEDRRESLGRRGVNEITVMDKYRLLQRSMSDTTAEETQKSLPQLPPVMHATSSVRMQPLAPQAASEMAPVSSLPAMIAQSMQALDEQLNQELAAVSSKLRTQTPHVVVAPSAPVIPDVIGIHIDNNNEQKRTKARLVFGSWSKEIF